LAIELQASRTTPEYADAMNAVHILTEGEYGTLTASDINNQVNVAKGRRSGTPATALAGEIMMLRKEEWKNADDEMRSPQHPEWFVHLMLLMIAGPFADYDGDLDEIGQHSLTEIYENFGIDPAKGIAGLVEQYEPKRKAMAERITDTAESYKEAAIFYRFAWYQWHDDEAETRGRIKRILEWREKRIEARVNPSRRHKRR